jgi:hypothetical protein
MFKSCSTHSHVSFFPPFSGSNPGSQTKARSSGGALPSLWAPSVVEYLFLQNQARFTTNANDTGIKIGKGENEATEATKEVRHEFFCSVRGPQRCLLRVLRPQCSQVIVCAKQAQSTASTYDTGNKREKRRRSHRSNESGVTRIVQTRAHSS